jgi:triacylglycerol esterase/lipase EstA (alpha/beta hydrolase family)
MATIKRMVGGVLAGMVVGGFALAGCTSDDGNSAANPNDVCDVVVADADCDETKGPIVFVHGTYGSGDNIANVAQLFGSNGYCQDRFVAVEYNSLGGNPLAEGSPYKHPSLSTTTGRVHGSTARRRHHAACSKHWNR